MIDEHDDIDQILAETKSKLAAISPKMKYILTVIYEDNNFVIVSNIGHPRLQTVLKDLGETTIHGSSLN